MAEEVRDASRTVPRVMISTVILNAVLGFVMVITFCFCITDLQAALGTTTGYPFIEVFYASTNSKAGTTVMVVIVILLIVCCAISQLATASRQAFAFARDEGLPFPHLFRKVGEDNQLRKFAAANSHILRLSKSALKSPSTPFLSLFPLPS
jgi:choline transport protein